MSNRSGQRPPRRGWLGQSSATKTLFDSLRDKEAEESVLGFLTLNKDQVKGFLDRGLRASHFSEPRNEQLFALLVRHAQQKNLEPSELAELKKIAGGRGEIARLAELSASPSIISAFQEASIIRDLSIRRQLVEAALDTRTPLEAVTRDLLIASRPSPSDEEIRFPAPLREEAFFGPIGRHARIIEPHTEADAAAILSQSLISYGSMVGRGPHILVEADEHHANEFGLLVGKTARGRKGTSKGHVKRVAEQIDPAWTQKCVQSGLSSGEGIIAALATGEEGDTTNDPRLHLEEGEFAQPLTVLRREGNTLSPVLRSAWDGDRLSTLTRKNPLSASGCHVSVMAHITEAELKRKLTATDMANGFANRFLIFRVRRANLLPFGGEVPQDQVDAVTSELSTNLRLAKNLGHRRIPFNPDARELWEAVYSDLSRDRHGLVDDLTARAEAHVLRLALIFCLSAGQTEISTNHLRAALAVWDYCEASVESLFGDRLGDPLADRVLAAIRKNPEGITRTELHRLLGNRCPGRELQLALDSLQSQYLVVEVEKGHRNKRLLAIDTKPRSANSDETSSEFEVRAFEDGHPSNPLGPSEGAP